MSRNDTVNEAIANPLNVKFYYTFKGVVYSFGEAENILEWDDMCGGLNTYVHPQAELHETPYKTHWDYCLARLELACEEPHNNELKDSLNQAKVERGQDMFDMAVAVSRYKQALIRAKRAKRKLEWLINNDSTIRQQFIAR